MYKESKNGLLIGTLFTICSLFASFTIIVPLISVLPGVFLEAISKEIVPNDPYSNVAMLTIFLLVLALIATLILNIREIKQDALKHQPLSKGKVAELMAVFYLIVHPLGFYIYWGLYLDFPNDGQLLFSASKSFLISSCSFVLFGVLIDWTRHTTAKKLLAKGDSDNKNEAE